MPISLGGTKGDRGSCFNILANASTSDLIVFMQKARRVKSGNPAAGQADTQDHLAWVIDTCDRIIKVRDMAVASYKENLPNRKEV